ncbi:hypothetical protein E2C01_023990 [Portunus trituberculatus]|uniref:Uncharacterized protein n=1 Tax=Portunus trituberculatus TaxID=210409 RepID=A0A5B7E9A5_PORTR|nr:hypothetical protein [Portunus trituberculatus]
MKDSEKHWKGRVLPDWGGKTMEGDGEKQVRRRRCGVRESAAVGRGVSSLLTPRQLAPSYLSRFYSPPSYFHRPPSLLPLFSPCVAGIGRQT